MEATWVQEAFKYGLPTFLLLAGCYGIWRILWAIGTFLAPLVTEVFKGMKAFLETNVQFLQKMEVLGDGLLKQQEAQTSLMSRQDEKINEIHKVIVQK